MSNMNPEYKHSRFLACPPEGGFPICFGVVTACNPNGLVTHDAQNVAATEKLRWQLEVRGRVFFPVTGCSLDLTHQEPGFGVVCQIAKEMVEIGRIWQQEAVFWIEDGIVYLLPCGSDERAVVGRWETLVLVGDATVRTKRANRIFTGEHDER